MSANRILMGFFLKTEMCIRDRFANDRHRVNSETAIIIGDSRFDRLFCEYGTMDLYRRQAVERLHNSTVCQFQRLVNGLALDEDVYKRQVSLLDAGEEY